MKRTQLTFPLALIVCSGICSSCYSGDGYTMHFKGTTSKRQPVEMGLNRNGQNVSGRYSLTGGGMTGFRYFESKIAFDAVNKYYTGGGTQSRTGVKGLWDGHLITLDIRPQFDTITITDCIDVDNPHMPYRYVIMNVVK